MLKIKIRHILNLQIKGLAQLPAKHILQIHPDEIPTLKEKIEIQTRREIGDNIKTELDRNQQESTSAVINIGYPFAVADGNRYHGNAKTNQLIEQKTTADVAIVEMARRKSHLRANKRNPELEMLARTNKLLINLDNVERCIHAENQIINNIENTLETNNFENTRKVVNKKTYKTDKTTFENEKTNPNFDNKTNQNFEINIKACRNQVGQTQALAEHYGLYRDIFGPAFSNNNFNSTTNENSPSSQYTFHPHVPMQILYSHSETQKSGDLERIELGKEGGIETETVDNENTNEITNEIESLTDLNSSKEKSADFLNSNNENINEKYVFSPVYRGNILDAFETSQSPEVTILTPYATCSLIHINNSEKNIKTCRSADLGYYTLLLTSLDPGLPFTVEKPLQNTENISVLPSPFYDHTPDQLIKGGAFDSLDRRNVKHIERYDTVKRYRDSLDNPNTSIPLQLNVPPRFLNDNKINILKTLNSADLQSGDLNGIKTQNHMAEIGNSSDISNLSGDINGIKTQNHMRATKNTSDISLSADIKGLKTQKPMMETGKTAVSKSADLLKKLYQTDSNKFDLTGQGIIDDPRNEVLHWFVANIPAHADVPSRVKFFPKQSADLNQPDELMNECKTGDGEGQQLLPYIRPFFPRGLGYHRMVFLLFHHKAAVPTSDYASYLMTLSKENAAQKSSADTILNNQLISSRVFSSRHFYRTFQSELTAVGISWFQATWHDSLHSFYQKELKIPAPSVEYQQLDPFRSDQMSFPAKQKFNTYLDYYEDPKARAKRVSLAQLTHVNASPFVQSWSRAQRSAESFLLNVDTSMKNIKTKWMRDDITKQRLGQPPYDKIYQLDD